MVASVRKGAAKKSGKAVSRGSSKEPSIAIVGCGNIGGSLLFALAKNEAFRTRKLIACDTDSARVHELATEFGVSAETDPEKAIAAAEIVVLALTPGDARLFLSGRRRAKALAGKIVISVSVGISIAQVAKAFPGASIARVMPNLPMAIGLGMSCIYAEADGAAESARQLFETTGLTLRLSREEDLDIGMAIASCGPAFFYTALEAIVDGGVFAGLSRESAELMAAQTMLGSAALLLEGGSSASDLREYVSTPGGTTVEGLYVLEKAGVRAAFMKAVGKASQKARIIREQLEG